MRFVRTKRRNGRRLLGVILCSLLLLARQAHGVTVWIDTDPSIGLPFHEVDDAFALVLAFHSPEIRIAGISTTYGNASLEATTRIARDLAERFGNCEVFPGARSRKDLGRGTAATDGLAAALRKKRLTYLALGPLTNLATFLRLHPELASRIDRVIAVGGQTSSEELRIGTNGWLRIHDANIFKDPTAAGEILRSKCPISLAPIVVSIRLVVTPADLQNARHSFAGEFLYRHTHGWMWFWHRIIRMDGGPLFDALPVLAIIRSDLVPSDERYGMLNETGALIVQKTPNKGHRRIRFYSAFKPGARKLLNERL